MKVVRFLNELNGEWIIGLEVPLQLLRDTTRRRKESQTPETDLFKGIWWFRTFSRGLCRA